jgi:hypothetical protein
MTLLFSAIIYVNADLTESIRETLISQLMLSDVVDGYEFDARVIADPNYPEEIHLNHLRVLVIRSLFDYTNRDLADIVIFIKAGLVYVECNKVGPPGLTLPLARLQLEEIIDPVRVKSCCDFDCCRCHHRFPEYCGPIQSNILYPRFNHHKTFRYPFGTEPICEKKK